MTESAYVDNADYPGGFIAYSDVLSDGAAALLNQVSFAAGSLIADAFLVCISSLKPYNTALR
jgi:hypothetical protein